MVGFTATRISIILIGILFLLIFLPNTLIAADTTYTPLAPIPGITSNPDTDLGGYLNSLFRIGITIAALLAVVMIVIGGLQYMTSESLGNKGEGRERIKMAILGLVLVLASIMILSVINPNITGFDLTFTTTTPPPPSTTPPPPPSSDDQDRYCFTYERRVPPGSAGRHIERCFSSQQACAATQTQCQQYHDQCQAKLAVCYADPLRLRGDCEIARNICLSESPECGGFLSAEESCHDTQYTPTTGRQDVEPRWCFVDDGSSREFTTENACTSALERSIAEYDTRLATALENRQEEFRNFETLLGYLVVSKLYTIHEDDNEVTIETTNFQCNDATKTEGGVEKTVYFFFYPPLIEPTSIDYADLGRNVLDIPLEIDAEWVQEYETPTLCAERKEQKAKDTAWAMEKLMESQDSLEGIPMGEIKYPQSCSVC